MTGKKKQMAIGLAVLLCILLLGFAIFRAKAPPDRMFKGKWVSQWVAACVEKPENFFDKRNNPELDAIREIGPDAVPHLIAAIQSNHGIRGSKFYNTSYPKIPAALSRRLPPPRDSQLIRIRAYWTLAAFGPSARSAVPFLVRQFNTNNSELDFVRATLMELGPEARESIPALIKAFHGPDGTLRWDAGLILAKVDPDNKELIPAMLMDLKSSNVITRRFACMVLGELGPLAKTTTPALTEALQDEDGWVKRRATEALKKIQFPPDEENGGQLK